MVETEQIWQWLAEARDPEIPVLSVVDLGVVRNVAWSGEDLVIAVTPTYSGCPATQAIANAIVATLAKHGLKRVTIKPQIAPPWRSDWMSDAGKAQLAAYGIAPPGANGTVTCPRCGTAETNEISRFGSTPCKAQYRCTRCQEPFEHFKCH